MNLSSDMTEMTDMISVTDTTDMISMNHKHLKGLELQSWAKHLEQNREIQ